MAQRISSRVDMGARNGHRPDDDATHAALDALKERHFLVCTQCTFIQPEGLGECIACGCPILRVVPDDDIMDARD